MLFASLILLTTAAGGLATTYLFDEEMPLGVRLAAGAAVGMAVFGFAGALLAFAFGVTSLTAITAALISAAPLVVFRNRTYRDLLSTEASRFQWDIYSLITFTRPAAFVAAVAYAGLAVLLFQFFRRAMLDMKGGGIGTGAVNNLGDLPFHMLVVNGFAIGQNFPPDNPIFSGTTMSYPFITDFIAAMLNVAGASVHDAMLLQNVVLILAIVILMGWFTYRFTGSSFAAVIAPFLLLFNGGLGFLLFFGDAIKSDAGILGQVFQLNSDYTLRGGTIWRWGDALTTLFVTQRTLLLGMPLALIVFTKVWDWLNNKNNVEENSENGDVTFLSPTQIPYVVVGLIAGLLLLIHTHTFLVVSAVTGFIALIDWRRWRMWAAFLMGAAVTTVPQLIFATNGTATSAGSFIGFDLGWDNGDNNALWFWFVNTGIFLPLLAMALWFLLRTASNKEQRLDEPSARPQASRMLLFFFPFILCFVGANTLRLAPWIWDNIKVLIYCYVASVPLVAWLLSRVLRRPFGYAAVSASIVILIFSGFLDVWRTATAQIEHQIIDSSMVTAANELNSKIPRDSLIVTAPEFATIPVLTGSRWFLGYTGHVWSHGIDPYRRQDIVKKIYAGGEESKKLIDDNGIDYVVVGPQEESFTKVDETFFQQFPLAAQSGEFKVFEVRNRR